MFKSMILQTLVFSAAVLAAAGCQQAATNSAAGFAPDEQMVAMKHLNNAQAARGAASDATLYSCHFDGPAVNSLGKAKLDLMLAAADNESDASVSVWMDVPDDQNADDRREAVKAYLRQRGLPSDRLVIGRGPNPAVDSPAAQGLKDLPKADSVDTSTSGATSSTAPPAGTP